MTPSGGGFECDKGGYLWTSQSVIHFITGGVGVAICYNGVNDQVLFKTGWPAIWNQITTAPWSATDNFFPEYGMAAF